jgi:hypothetical protein
LECNIYAAFEAVKRKNVDNYGHDHSMYFFKKEEYGRESTQPPQGQRNPKEDWNSQ